MKSIIAAFLIKLQYPNPYLNRLRCNGSNSEESESGFPDLRQLEEYSRAGMICLLQQVRPRLSKSDAMWCFLMSDLPSVDNDGVGVLSPAMCRFHGGWGFGNGSEFAVNEFFDKRNASLKTPSYPTCFIDNPVARKKTCSFDGDRPLLITINSARTGGPPPIFSENEPRTEPLSVSFLIKPPIPPLSHPIAIAPSTLSLRKPSGGEDGERRDAANEEGETHNRGINHEKVFRDEMENALRKASGQVDRTNAAVRRLETENAEIRAEMEASKLSASESVTTCLEELIADEKEKIKDLRRCLARAEQDQKETESKWREELKDKELALAQVEQERCSKEATEAINKRKLEVLRLKIEIDFQRHKDDHQRLEQELSRLKLSAQSTELNHQSDNLFTGKSEGAKPQGETITKLLHEFDTRGFFGERS
ncbi:plant intracellular Ras-group-related LRR protein 5-like [Hibiscus syriacus]|uniref:Plant intracellular Ras-group-related LRR protein 5-like n=1 Tax=Hibiscus syriacus TaxID=106335 RepID=A0A6A2X0V3_HIBSY|nr:plant intracellular Ras-group-related LRR protein 5-like [Hibiscus syriacus]